MRLIAFILSMVILTSSLNANNFVRGLSILYSSQDVEGQETIDACCSVKVYEGFNDENKSESYIESHDSDHSKGFCNGVNCDCKCCGHIVFVQPGMNLLRFLPVMFHETFKFSFDYQRKFVNSTFIPPNRS